MDKTANLGLPLVAPAQAQKHVTVNEAIALLDVAAQLSVVASDRTDPPADAPEGAGYLVPEGAGGAWAGRPGAIAVRANGGWLFLAPRAGWRLWDAGAGIARFHDGTDWIAEALSASAGGAATLWQVIETDHAIEAGTTSTVAGAIPAQTVVIGVTGRVLEGITGAGLTAWQLGVADSPTRYGSGLGLAPGSFARGLTGNPLAYYAPTDLVLTAQGGAFAGGTVRLAVHCLALTPPRAV